MTLLSEGILRSSSCLSGCRWLDLSYGDVFGQQILIYWCAQSLYSLVGMCCTDFRTHFYINMKVKQKFVWARYLIREKKLLLCFSLDIDPIISIALTRKYSRLVLFWLQFHLGIRIYQNWSVYALRSWRQQLTAAGSSLLLRCLLLLQIYFNIHIS